MDVRQDVLFFQTLADQNHFQSLELHIAVDTCNVSPPRGENHKARKCLASLSLFLTGRTYYVKEDFLCAICSSLNR